MATMRSTRPVRASTPTTIGWPSDDAPPYERSAAEADDGTVATAIAASAAAASRRGVMRDILSADRADADDRVVLAEEDRGLAGRRGGERLEQLDLVPAEPARDRARAVAQLHARDGRLVAVQPHAADGDAARVERLAGPDGDRVRTRVG